MGDPLAAAASNFQKRSTPPSQLSPADGALMTEQPVFRWTSVEGARRYRFQVAQEPTFAALLEDVTTASTSYTPFTTHPADTNLYWRVRADDENLIGLTWSPVRQFQRRLPTPVPASDNATSGDFTPVWMWSHVEGASGYTFSMDGPEGTHKEWPNMRLRAGCVRLSVRPRHLALASSRRVPEDGRLRHRPVVGLHSLHEDDQRARQRADEPFGQPPAPLLGLEARRQELPRPDLDAPGLRTR